MILSTEEIRKDCKQIAKRRVTQDGLVCPDPAFLYAVIVSPKDNKKCTAKVYDGHDTSDDFWLDVRAFTQVTRPITFSTPMYFRRGIYVCLCGDTLSVVLHFLPVKE